jgi:hypothetical protein
MTECPTHPGAESVGTCERCGRFYCAAERIDLDLHFYCGDCGTRDDVDWLGKHYRRLEGRRSGLAWFIFATGIVSCAGAGAVLIGAENWKERGFFLGVLLFGAASLTVMSGKAWSRLAMLASVPISALIFIFSSGQPWSALGAAPALLLSLSTFTDVPTQLFFRLPVSRSVLRKHYDREGSNPLAVRASRLAVLSLFVPGLSAVTLVMGVIALTRVNSKAIPPVGNVSAALGAIVFSLFTALIWLSAFFGLG